MKRGIYSERISEKSLRYAFLLPALIVLVLLLGFPILSSLYYSTTNKNLIYPNTHFIGMDNFKTVLSDPVFWSSFVNSIKFTILIVAAQFLVGLVAALALNHIRHYKGLFRTLLIVPWTFPNIVMSSTWSWLLNDLYGPVNGILMKMGIIDKPILFLSDPVLAASSVVLVMTWFGFPFMMVNILAALQSISKSEYEAAYLDGANALTAFRHITLPHLKSVIGLVLCLRVIWVFNNFDFIFLFTGGGPGNATETLPLYAYRMGWKMNSLGGASSVAVILFIFLMIGTLIYFHIINRKERMD